MPPMPLHYEIKPTEPMGCTIRASVFSYLLHKILVESNNKLLQDDFLSLRGKINSPPELYGHEISVEYYKKEEAQNTVIEGYKAIGEFFFMEDWHHATTIEIARGGGRGYFAAAINVDCKIFDDLTQTIIALDGRNDIDRVIFLTVIGLLNHWDLEGKLPITIFQLTFGSQSKTSQMQKVGEPPAVILYPPLTYKNEK
jgi:hypothetical protein